MEQKALSIRPFIGARDFTESQNFYRDLGFQERVISGTFSLFQTGSIGFYLQDAYVKDWINNTMVFLEVDDVESYWSRLLALDLTTRYKNVKLLPIRQEEWGSECFLHDPSGVLWHIGQFRSR